MVRFYLEIKNDRMSYFEKELNIPVYEFLKEPLIRKMGEEWYQELSDIARDWRNRVV